MTKLYYADLIKMENALNDYCGGGGRVENPLFSISFSYSPGNQRDVVFGGAS